MMPSEPQRAPSRPAVTPRLLQIPQVLPGSSSPSGAVNYHLHQAGVTGLREGKEEGGAKGTATCGTTSRHCPILARATTHCLLPAFPRPAHVISDVPLPYPRP